jgi:hypothetical protein
VVIAAGYLHMPALFLKDADQANRVLFAETVSKDRPLHYQDKCHLGHKSKAQGECVYGDVAGKRRVALFGDSHAAQWFAALNQAGKQSGWKLHPSTKAACPFPEVALLYRTGDRYTDCWEWREQIMAELTGPDRPDLIVLSSYLSIYNDRLYDAASGQRLAPAQAQEALRIGVRKTIEKLLATGAEIALIRDTPQAHPNYKRCFIANKSNCARRRDQALPARDIEDLVVREFAGRVKLFDFTDAICPGAECPITSNGIMVYRDQHHLTASFSASLAPQMVQLLDTFAQTRGPVEGGAHPGVAAAGKHLRFDPALGKAAQ